MIDRIWLFNGIGLLVAAAIAQYLLGWPTIAELLGVLGGFLIIVDMGSWAESWKSAKDETPKPLTRPRLALAILGGVGFLIWAGFSIVSCAEALRTRQIASQMKGSHHRLVPLASEPVNFYFQLVLTAFPVLILLAILPVLIWALVSKRKEKRQQAKPASENPKQNF